MKRKILVPVCKKSDARFKNKDEIPVVYIEKSYISIGCIIYLFIFLFADDVKVFRRPILEGIKQLNSTRSGQI